LTFFQALRYFLGEASLNLVRSWKISLLAIITIAVSLFVGGLFWLVTTNLSAWVGEWRSEARVVVYLRPDTPAESVAALQQEIRQAPWTVDVTEISADAARERFRQLFPSLSDLVEDWPEAPLPPSLEIRYRGDGLEPAAFEAWLEALRASPAAELVDDDRDWLQQLQTVVGIIRAAGLSLGVVLLGAAVFTIASVVRLTAHLYREEISIMRLVGATEFFIRGPFYMEGLLQGLLGGALAAAGLYGAFRLLIGSEPSLVVSLLTPTFLSLGQLGLLVVFGGLAGVFGAVASLHRESLKVSQE